MAKASPNEMTIISIFKIISFSKAYIANMYPMTMPMNFSLLIPPS